MAQRTIWPLKTPTSCSCAGICVWYAFWHRCVCLFVCSMEAEQVFMNPLFFHTGLMVIKPSLEKFNSLLKNLQSTESVSYDGGAFFFGCQSLNSADSFSLQRIKAFSSRSLSMWRVSACLILLEACRKAQSSGQLFLSCVLFWEHFSLSTQLGTGLQFQPCLLLPVLHVAHLPSRPQVSRASCPRLDNRISNWPVLEALELVAVCFLRSPLAVARGATFGPQLVF